MARKFVSGVLAFAMVFGATAPVVFAEPVATEVVDQEANYLPSLEKSSVTMKNGDVVMIKVNDIEDGAKLVCSTIDGATNPWYTYQYIKASKTLVITASNAAGATDKKYTFTITDTAKDALGNEINNYSTHDLELEIKVPSTPAAWGGWAPTDTSDIELTAGKTKDIVITHGTNTAPKTLSWKLTTAAQEYVSVSTSAVTENGVVTGTKITFTGLKAIPKTEDRTVAITLTADGTTFAERRIKVGTASASAALTLKANTEKISADATLTTGASLVAQAYKTNAYGDLVADDDADLVWSINGKGAVLYADKTSTPIAKILDTTAGKGIKTFTASEVGTYTITVSDAAGSHVATKTITVTSTVAPALKDGYVAKSATDLKYEVANQSRKVKPGTTVEIGNLPYAAYTKTDKSSATYMSSLSGYKVTYSVDPASKKYISSYDAATGKFVIVDENDVDMKAALASTDKKAVINVKATFTKSGSQTVEVPYTIEVTTVGAKAASFNVTDGDKLDITAKDEDNKRIVVGNVVMAAGSTKEFKTVAKDANGFTDVAQDVIWYLQNTSDKDTTKYAEVNNGKLTALVESAGKVELVGVSASNPDLKVYIQLYITAAKPTATPTATATPAPTATTAPTAAPTTAPATKTGKVTASSLRVRETPVNGTVVGKLAKGTAVTVTEEKDGWYKVTAGTLTGWVSGEYVELTTPSTTETATTTANLKLRKTAKTGSVITTMPKGSKVEVLEKGSEWSKVKYNGKTGFASNAYLEFEEDAVG